MLCRAWRAVLGLCLGVNRGDEGQQHVEILVRDAALSVWERYISVCCIMCTQVMPLVGKHGRVTWWNSSECLQGFGQGSGPWCPAVFISLFILSVSVAKRGGVAPHWWSRCASTPLYLACRPLGRVKGQNTPARKLQGTLLCT